MAYFEEEDKYLENKDKLPAEIYEGEMEPDTLMGM